VRRDHDGAGGNLIGSGAGCSSSFDLHRFAALPNWRVPIRRGLPGNRGRMCAERLQRYPGRSEKVASRSWRSLFDRDQVQRPVERVSWLKRSTESEQ
jgi:hypothetical protein